MCREELRYLGYVVDKNGIYVDQAKVQALVDIPQPTSMTEVRRLVGIASWYRRFVPNFSSVVASNTRLLKKRVKFEVDDRCQEAWATIQDCLVTAHILSCPVFEKKFVLQTDASNVGIGEVLTQNYGDSETVICYLSSSLARQERNFATTDCKVPLCAKELLAILWAVGKLRPYLEGTHFSVITDHYSLLWLHNLENLSGRLARWVIRLQPYDFTVIHRKGKEHIIPDLLSRAVPVIDAVKEKKSHQTNGAIQRDNWYDRLISAIQRKPCSYPEFCVEDGVLFKYVEERYPDLDGTTRSWKQVIPKSQRDKILKECHDQPIMAFL